MQAFQQQQIVEELFDRQIYQRIGGGRLDQLCEIADKRVRPVDLQDLCRRLIALLQQPPNALHIALRTSLRGDQAAGAPLQHFAFSHLGDTIAEDSAEACNQLPERGRIQLGGCLLGLGLCLR